MAKPKEYFPYRTVLGAWINDICSVPRVEKWPSTIFDATLKKDFIGFFDLMQAAGLNSAVFFGLFVAAAWDRDFRRSISPERDRIARWLLDEAHRRGIRVFYGIGLYSWGFDKIIRDTPAVRGTNPHALCASREESHRIMEELIRFLLTAYPFDGLHFESGDQGRCSCRRCAAKDDLSYHIALNERMGRYVRAGWPDKIIEVYTPGVNKTKQNWLQWSRAGRYFSFIIDADIRQRQQDVADHFGGTSRPEIVSALPCAYGTRSGTWIYPPQRWHRLRWFLPLIDRRATHYRRLAEDGGKAVMVSGAPLVNPGEEATLRFSGKMIRDPFRDVPAALRETMEEMFEPRLSGVAEELADIFWYAEKAYFSNAMSFENYEIFLEPLFGKKPGPPVYLQGAMTHLGLVEYDTAIADLQRRVAKIQREVARADPVRRLEKCLAAVRQDLRTIIRKKTMLP